MSLTLESAAPAPAAHDTRHPTLAVLCGRYERIMHGLAAEELLAAGNLPDRAGVVTLPAWSWEHPLIDVGRKAKAHRTGERMLMPVRNSFDTAVVVLVTDAAVPVSHRTAGMGHTFAGQSRLVPRPGEAPAVNVTELPTMATPVFVGAGTRSRTAAVLAALVADGKAARWEILTWLEPRLRSFAHQAHASVSYEIGLTTGVVEPMLDELTVEQIVDDMMYGSNSAEEDGRETGKPSAMFRLIELCLKPETFLRVDPLKYMTKHMRRDVEAQIRRRLGDPHIGPKIREIARQYPRAEIADIVEAYRAVYPKDRLSLPRAEAALSVTPSAAARCETLADDGFHSRVSFEGSMAA